MKIVWKQKKERSESNQRILIHSSVSFLKNNILTRFANIRSLDESSNSMDEEFFLQKIEVTRWIGRL